MGEWTAISPHLWKGEEGWEERKWEAMNGIPWIKTKAAVLTKSRVKLVIWIQCYGLMESLAEVKYNTYDYLKLQRG